MKKTTLPLLLSFLFVFFATAQSKDSIHFYKMYHDVPVKYKLAHFGLRGKVKSFYETTIPENEDNEKLIYEFDENGNLIQVKNSYGYVSQKFNYDKSGKLISYTTSAKSMRDFQATINEKGNVVQLIINNKDYGVSTIVNEFNKNGFWTKQSRLEGKSTILENKYQDDIKLTDNIAYNNNKISESTHFDYHFFNVFVQIKLTYKYEDTESVTYIYSDYFGNPIFGFPFEEGNLSDAQIKEVLNNFKLDKNNNWIKNQEITRVIDYY